MGEKQQRRERGRDEKEVGERERGRERGRDMEERE